MCCHLVDWKQGNLEELQVWKQTLLHLNHFFLPQAVGSEWTDVLMLPDRVELIHCTKLLESGPFVDAAEGPSLPVAIKLDDSSLWSTVSYTHSQSLFSSNNPESTDCYVLDISFHTVSLHCVCSHLHHLFFFALFYFDTVYNRAHCGCVATNIISLGINKLFLISDFNLISAKSSRGFM